MDTIAKILRDWKATQTVGWNKLAAGSGWTGETWRKWSSGENEPPASAVPAISRMTGVPVAELLGGDPGAPALSDMDKAILEAVHALGVDPHEVLRAVYRLPRGPARPSSLVRQLAGYDLTPPCVDEDAEPEAPEGDNNDTPLPPANGRRPR